MRKSFYIILGLLALALTLSISDADTENTKQTSELDNIDKMISCPPAQEIKWGLPKNAFGKGLYTAKIKDTSIEMQSNQIYRFNKDSMQPTELANSMILTGTRKNEIICKYKTADDQQHLTLSTETRDVRFIPQADDNWELLASSSPVVISTKSCDNTLSECKIKVSK